MHEALDQAYARGDHKTASGLAARIVSGELGAETTELCVRRARTILAETEPDRFLATIGALGLGLVAWLVYNYVL